MKKFLTVIFLFSLGYCTMAWSHAMTTAYLEIHSDGRGAAVVSMKYAIIDPFVVPIFPSDCRRFSVQDLIKTESVATEEEEISGQLIYNLVCKQPLEGRKIKITGMGPIITDTIIRITSNDGPILSKILTASEDSWMIPEKQTLGEFAFAYLTKGFWHILEGADHLLFLLSVLLLVPSPRRLFYTATAFTLSHSLTLVFTVLGLIKVSSIAAEACIALTLIYVALEIRDKHPNGVTDSKFGPIAGFCFGLIHGLGFAGALVEIGLPKDAIAIALAMFNVGVEFGQIVFLFAGIMVLKLFISAGQDRKFILTSTYTIGSLGVFWFICRAAGVLTVALK